MAIEKLSVILELLAGQYKKEVKEAARDTDRLTSSLNKTGQMASRIGGALTTGLTLPLAGLAVGAVKAASNLSESMNAINVVFKEAAGTVEAFGETAATSAGLSQRAFNEAIVPIGQLLNNFGFEANASADAVLALTQRAADLGSTLNIDTAVALEKFQSGLAGEAEPLKAFGVDVSVAAIKAEALALGLIRSGEEMSKNVRAQAALSIIMRETAFAAGDFSRTLEESLPNQLKELKANAENLAAALGTALLPSVLDMVKGIQSLVDRFTDLSEAQQEFIVKTGLTVAALGPALFVTGKLVKAFVALRAAVLGLNVVFGLAGGGGLIAGLKSFGTAAVGATAWLRNLGTGFLQAAAHQEVLNFALEQGENKTAEEAAAIEAMHAQFVKLADKTDEVTAKIFNASAAQDSWMRGVKETVEVHDSWNTGLARTQAGLGDVAEVSSEAREKALELRDANREAAKSFRDDLTEAIGGFVTFFEGAVTEIDSSLKKLEAQWAARSTQNERFWNGLAVLAGAGLDDLVAELQTQGVEAVGVVEDLVADMDTAFAWERRIEENARQAAAMMNALVNAAAGEMDTVGAAFNAFGISLADQLEAGFSTADLSNTLTQLMDLADPSGGTTPGGSQFQQFASGGVVQGPWGSPQLVIAHAGERVIPIGGGGNVTGGTTIVVQSPMSDFRSDLQYATILASVTNLVEAL